jgi:cell division protein FtsW
VARKIKRDRVLFVTVMVLLAVSVVMVYSASAVMAQERYGDASHYAARQGLFIFFGVVAMAIAMHVDYTFYKRPRIIGGLLVVTALALILVRLIGPEIKGARRWFSVFGFGVQPSELAKIAMILFTAWVLDRRMDKIDDPREALLPVGAVLAGMLGLVLLGKDLGTSAAIAATVLVMVFAAGLPWKYLAWVSAGSVPVLAYLLSADYRWKRITAFLNPEADPQGSGFQIIQSKIAIGTGGLTGLGIGDGVQKRFYLPEPHNDFIFAAISEETGLIGATILLVCFAVLIWRGVRTVLRAPDRFASLTALGLTMMIGAQGLVNMSVALGLLPTKGIPLPLVSYGGSSTLVALTAMGMLLNISQHATGEEWD